MLKSRTAFLFCLLTFAAPLRAQTTFASITGTVSDATGAAAPNVTITATNLETGLAVETRSNEAGNYTIAQLKEGSYTLRAKSAGFKEFVVQNIGLVARDVRRVDVRMELGSVETSVEVAAGATLIETETARITDEKDSKLLNTLPLNTRGLWAYLVLSPGLQQQPGSSIVRFAGSRVNQSNWAIDGTSFADGVDNTQTGPLANYIESFQEVKVDLANNSAEFGSMGQVTIISKSGSNDYHGSLFDYYSTPFFRAKGPFDVARGTGITHQPGGSIGGPVLLPKIYNGRNRTFFFFSYETARGSQRTQNLNPTVPLTAWRNGDFSGLSTVVRDPFSGTPFPGNRIPADRINAVSRKIQDRFYPTPNFGDGSTLVSQNYREGKTRPYDPSTYWTTRGDHKITEKDSVYGRFTWHRLYNRPWEGNLPTIGRRIQQRDDRAATASYTHMFRPTLLNEFRWGFGFNNNPVIGPVNGPDLVKDLGLVGLAPDLPNVAGMLKVSWSGIGLQRLTQPDYTSPGYRTHTEDFQDHVSWFRGRHNLKFGFNLLRAGFDEYSANSNLFGSVTFSNRFTGHPYGDFLLGIPTSAARAFAPLKLERSRWSYDFYALDDFKLSSKLTLNLGLRYELHMPWQENNNLMSLFDVKSGQIVVPDGALSKVSSIFPKGYVGITEASKVGFDGRSLVHNDRNNIAPRIGIAYRPKGNNTVIRAGFGLFYDVVPFVYALGFGGVPFILDEPRFTNPVGRPEVIFPRVFPTTGTGGPDTIGLPAAENPNYRTPYSMQYNFTIERQQWNTGFRVSYIGTAGRKAPWAYNYNSPIPNRQDYVDKPRPFSSFPDIFYVTNGAGHQYNALTAEATRHLSGGLYFQGSWTWARDRYDLDYNWDFDSWKFTTENPFDRRRERAVAEDIPTHRLSANFIYQLPFGRGRRWGRSVNRLANLALGGWEISGVFSAQTGNFLTPFWTGPDPVGIAYTESDPADVSIRPDVLRNPNLAAGQRSISRWFDTSAFAPPSAGRFGTSAKGVIKGPGVNVWHAGFHKDFFFNERMRLRWEMTAVNFFNHPNWANPGTDLSDPQNFGVVTGTGGVNNGSAGDRTDARSFRMGLRLQF